MLRLMMATKKQIIEKQRLRYQKARKKERTAILTSLALSTELSRDHLARVLRNGYPDRTQGIKGKRGRKPVYGMAHKRLLVSVWTLLYYPSSRRLQAALPDVLAGSSEALRAEYKEKVIQDLLKMSHGTMDRLLKSNRQQVKPFGLSTTKPGKSPNKKCLDKKCR